MDNEIEQNVLKLWREKIKWKLRVYIQKHVQYVL